MNVLNSSVLAAVVTLMTAGASVAHAQVRITEIAPWASASTTPYQTDWFELTNFGDAAVDLTGWSMDDNSNGSAKVTLTGISSIAAGETVIFTETAATASFLNTWFGDQAPASLQIGNYTGKGVGLSQSGDAVNIYNASGALHASLTFGTSDGLTQTFDNAAGLNNTTVSQLSVVGVNGAFAAVNHLVEIGSPGAIAAAVPEPQTYALLLAGLGVFGLIARKRQR